MERPFTLDHLDHIVLRVRDLKKSLAFYAMLGADGQREVAAGTVMRIAVNQSLIFQERSDYHPPEVGAIDHINLTIRAACPLAPPARQGSQSISSLVLPITPTKP